MAHFFTPEEAEFLREHVKGRGNQELTDLFNAHFDLNLALTQIMDYKKNHKLSSGLDGRFRPGQEPFNKGRKGVFLGGNVAEAAQFKMGHRPWNYMPVGSERVNDDGYVDIKVADPNKWKGKHIVIWEEHNGPVPKGHAVIFGDRNKRNFEPDNLILVSRKQLIRMNQSNLIKEAAELTKTGIIIADIYNKIGERRKTKP